MYNSYWNNSDFDPSAPLDPDKTYTGWELDQIANDILRKDSRKELCRKCDKVGVETGCTESMPQMDEDGVPITDSEGDILYVEFPEFECSNKHRWYKGEGRSRSISGENPILFENHIQDRKRREIYTSVGTPDPSIVSGSYNKTHPGGRRVNSDKQRKTNGASFYS